MSRRLIHELHQVPVQARDVAWLRENLQWAVQLEFSTIPPYLCALWSIVEAKGPVYDLILSVVMEEMYHMSLACNMLTTIGGTPEIATASAVPQYPGPLPGGVHPGLIVPLQGLTCDGVRSVFMQIELPENGPVAADATYPTIGDFYTAIGQVFQTLPPSAFTGAGQLTADIHGNHLFPVYSVIDALNAIDEIKEQGEGHSEGNSKSPFDLEGVFAHYYRFGEIANQRFLIQTPDGSWVYQGEPLPLPSTYPMAPVPSGGYPESIAFDTQYTGVLKSLQAAWSGGGQNALFEGVKAMFYLEGQARQLMQTPLPGGGGNYGPSFLLIADPQRLA